ncbi:hypothetical protein HDV05_006669 [Chytridiales sp. JEL 0842]|nr:hypothetical protein HDV05_006669 [Chytridiales sp. JEL 0842]
MDSNFVWSALQPFVFGGLAGMAATTVIQPVDMVKVRLQVVGQETRANPFAIASSIVKSEGIASLYTGLSAGLLRQATYTTARMGLFNTFMHYFQTVNTSSTTNSKPASPTFYQRAVAGLAAGAIGAMIGNPFDLALVRMQTDGMQPVAKRANYTSAPNAMFRIARSEGVLALWKGSGPTVARAMALNLGMLSTFSEAKSRLEPYTGRGTTQTQLSASAIAGFFASFFSLPFDFVKTRMQGQKPGPDGVLPYRGSLDCAVKVVAREGPFTFYKGFTTYYFRIAPHAMITLLVADSLNNLAKKSAV